MPLMSFSENLEFMQRVLDALGVDWRTRNVRRVTLVLDVENMGVVHVEEYPEGSPEMVDLVCGYVKQAQPTVVEGPPPSAGSGDF